MDECKNLPDDSGCMRIWREKRTCIGPLSSIEGTGLEVAKNLFGKEADVLKSIKMGCLRFVDHICRMDLSSLMLRSFNYKPIGTRTRDRPILSWVDCAEDHLKVLRVTNWKTVDKRRSEWKRVLGKALAHPGLLYY
ncbi:uncharacterized protein TNCV_3779311 [Trichonephila clavipes]|nr:uncharacterized protein TNCV_3779311 [Trichonephila clavipes]